MLNQNTNINRYPNVGLQKRNSDNLHNQPAQTRGRINSETYNSKPDRRQTMPQNVNRNEITLDNSNKLAQNKNYDNQAIYMSQKAYSIHEDSLNISKRSFQKAQNDVANKNYDYPMLPGINLQNYVEKYQRTSQN